VPLLEQQGVQVRALDLPSVGGDPATPVDLTGDAAAVRAVLDDVGPALLCGHSYGGMVITQAAAGRDDVTRLVYLCAFMPEAGESVLSIIGESSPDWILPTDDGRMLPDEDRLVEIVCARCDAEAQRTVKERVRPMQPAPFGEPVVEASWKRIPSTYVIGTHDMAIPADVQRNVFAPRATDIVEVESDHFPHFSHAQVVADILAARIESPAAV
jgi:pimeloyl-ACP methyl ester carboxylesterase